MGKLSETLNALKDVKRKALVAYIVAGDPVPGVTVSTMHALVRGGANVIELGVPFSDPEAEGPVIQLAHERALKHQVSLHDCLAMIAEFREQDQTTPIVLMGYLNPIEAMGYQAFTEAAAAAGVNGTIIVNLPPEEAEELSGHMAAHDLEPVYLLAPTTTDERARKICQASRGFVYYVSLKGTTGSANLDVADVAEKMARFMPVSDLPVMVGFGVRDGESARAVAGLSDGAVVGSAIVSLMAQHESEPELIAPAVESFVSTLRQAID